MCGVYIIQLNMQKKKKKVSCLVVQGQPQEGARAPFLILMTVPEPKQEIERPTQEVRGSRFSTIPVSLSLW